MKKILFLTFLFVAPPAVLYAQVAPEYYWSSAVPTINGAPVATGGIASVIAKIRGGGECGRSPVSDPSVAGYAFSIACSASDGDPIDFFISPSADIEHAVTTAETPTGSMGSIWGGSWVGNATYEINVDADVGCLEDSDCNNDGISCTDDTCDHTSPDADSDGCVHTANDALCDDGSECTTDVCDISADCQNTPVAEGTSCGDTSWNLCKAPDTCNAVGVCESGIVDAVMIYDSATGESTPGPCRDSGEDNPTCNPAEFCDGVSAECPAFDVKANSGTPCDDDNPCTQTDICDGSGSCDGSNPVVCTPDDSCHLAGTCNTETGDCSTGSEIIDCLTAADGCCPTACNANNDSDCDSFCGNRVVESGEDCDDANTIQGDGCQNGCTFSECVSGATDDCATGLDGVCAAGRKTCTDGVWGACVQITHAAATDVDCDSQDDDCDGDVDEDFVETPTNCGIGDCASTGEVVCESAGTRDTCRAGSSSEETCNGQDDDCDGATDEVDMDRDGYLACAPVDPAADTTPRDCNDSDGNINPGADELCDGIDNNCDTATDEGFNLREECVLGSNACETMGTIACDSAGGAECVGERADGIEIANTDGNPCTRDTCVAGEETHSPLDDDTVCEDGNVCTTNDVCTGGLCVSGDEVVPADEDANTCTVENCEQPDADAALVAHWTFEEGSGTTLFDLSGNHHDGVIFGNPVWVDDGKIGKALLLDGADDYVRIPNSPSLNPADELTIAAWYKPDSFVGVGNNAIVDKGATSHTQSDGYYQYHLGFTGDLYSNNASAPGRFSASVSDNTRLSGVGTQNVSSNGEWHHVVATFSRSEGKIRIFVNSDLERERSIPGGFGSMQDVGKDVFIGAFSNLDTNNPETLLKGTVDDIRIYDRALTGAEIAELFERTNNYDVAVENAPDESVCDDSDLCTTGDSCQDGTCTAVESRSCDDENPCTDDSCDTADLSADSETGCVHTNNTESCSDDDACNGEEICIDGACPDGVSPDCDDDDDCTADSCDAGTGCVNTIVDTDDDATPDCNDDCPTNPAKIAEGICGCSTADTDTDLDGTPDCRDDCDDDREKITAGTCGCHVADSDTDGDGTLDCNDRCPNDRTRTAPSTEVCDGVDNDCDPNTADGSADPQIGQPCDGADDDGCSDGQWVCQSGAPTCNDDAAQLVESCNGRDDDCDGQADDGFTLNAECDGPDADECKEGHIVCDADGSGTQCNDATTDSAEICGNTVDENCVGGLNDGCICEPGEKKACGATDVGDCDFGKQTCKEGKEWGPCDGAITAQPEACDGRDNDCNGQIDETKECEALKECVAGDTRPCGKDEGTCETGLQTCTPAGKWDPECTDEVKPVAEVCDDGEDNDCDKFRDDRDPDCVELCPDEKPPVASLCTIDVTTEAGMVCRDPEDNPVNSFTGFERILALASDSKWNLIVHDITDHVIRIDTRTGDTSLLTEEPMPIVRDLAMDKLGNTYIAAGENLVKVATDRKLIPIGKIEGLKKIAIVKDVPFLLDVTGKIHKLVEEKDAEGVSTIKPTLLTDLAALSEKPDEGTPETGGIIGDNKYLHVLLAEKNLVVTIDPETGKEAAPVADEKAPMTPDMIRQKMGPAADVLLCIWNKTAQPPCIPDEEVCDGADNDCDTVIDNGFDEDGDGVSICADDCDDTNAQVYPNADEACDGIDNNCDFCPDENCACLEGEERPCGVERGECHEGTHECLDGIWSAECVGSTGPTPEVCDGLDNNCNGRVDEAIKQEKITCGTGACEMKGKKVCEEGKMVDECVPGTRLSEQDSTCNGIDDDCDGKTDEDCEESDKEEGVKPDDKPIDGDVPPDGQGAGLPGPEDGASWLTGGACSLNPHVTANSGPASASVPLILVLSLLALLIPRLLRRRSDI